MTGGLLSACGAHVLTVAILHLTWCELPKVRRGSADCGLHDRLLILARIRTLPNLRVSPANYGKIRQGLTADEVEKLLGRPTIAGSRKKETKFVTTPEGLREIHVDETRTWIGVEQVIAVDFGEKGTVERSELEPLEEGAELSFVDTRSVLEMLREWLIAGLGK
jgi:hypothetical protein